MFLNFTKPIFTVKLSALLFHRMWKSFRPDGG